MAPVESPAGSSDGAASGEEVDVLSASEVEVAVVVDSVGSAAAASSDDVDVGAAPVTAGVAEVSD